MHTHLESNTIINENSSLAPVLKLAIRWILFQRYTLKFMRKRRQYFFSTNNLYFVEPAAELNNKTPQPHPIDSVLTVVRLRGLEVVQYTETFVSQTEGRIVNK